MIQLAVPDRAQRRIDAAVYAAIVSAVFTFVLGLMILMSEVRTPMQLAAAGIDVALTLSLAYGVARHSRAAAVALLALHILSTAFQLAANGFPSGLFGGVIFGYFYVLGILGTFQLAAWRRADASDPGRLVSSGAAQASGK
jgi:hypothetical protein